MVSLLLAVTLLCAIEFGSGIKSNMLGGMTRCSACVSIHLTEIV